MGESRMVVTLIRREVTADRRLHIATQDVLDCLAVFRDVEFTTADAVRVLVRQFPALTTREVDYATRAAFGRLIKSGKIAEGKDRVMRRSKRTPTTTYFVPCYCLCAPRSYGDIGALYRALRVGCAQAAESYLI